MPVGLETVVKQLSDSGIIAPGKLENFIPPKASPKDAEGLLRELFKQNLLTRFQAQQFAQGRGKSLILGGHTILDKIGAGGMGQVFKAEHRRMKRIVAIKTLPAAMMKDAAASARFQREVEAAAKLNHSNIVTAYDADEANGVHFLVMEYVEGSDLSALVKKNGPFSVDQAVNYILQAARGLEFAHKRGVIHRDIKPANLLLDTEGVVKILDMGLARIEAGGNAATQAELTGSGAIMGTVDYMAPEQALNTRHADARADIYSLGCSLYYLLLGRPVYDGETVTSKLLAHQGNPIPILRASRDDVPEALDAVLRKMLAKLPDERYQTMTEVIADLQPLVSGSGTNVGTTQGPIDSAASNSNLTFLNELPAQTVHRQSTKQTKVPGGAGFKHKKPALICGGVLGCVVLLGGIGFVVMNRGGSNSKLPSPLAGEGLGVRGSAPPLAVAPFDAAQARAHQEAWAEHLGIEVVTTNAAGSKMIFIPPGEFLMGSKQGEIEATKFSSVSETALESMRKSEQPRHPVRITRPFLMGATEVTRGQYKTFAAAANYRTEVEVANAKNLASYQAAVKAGKAPATPFKPAVTYLDFRDDLVDDSPAVWLGDRDIEAYIDWLTSEEAKRGGGGAYRLPSEAEWEYACRAGTTTHYWFGDDRRVAAQYCWTNAAGGGVQPVGQKPANPFGLYDMHGNATEWCQDEWDETWYARSPVDDPVNPSSGGQCVTRGGMAGDPFFSRSAHRHKLSKGYRGGGQGFRVVRVLDTNIGLARQPRSGYALEFDDPSTVEIPSLKLAPGAPLTLEAYLTATEPEDVHRHVLGVDGQFGLRISQGGAWGVQIYPSKDRKGVPLGTKTPLAVGQRIHVASVWADTALLLFLDGKRVGRAPLENYPLPDATAGFSLGGKFVGRIDEVRVSKSARYVYDFTPVPRHESDADTLALYHFDEGEGDLLRDSSRNNHHGKIVGAKWVRTDDSPIAPPSSVVLPAAGTKAADLLLLGDGFVARFDRRTLDAAFPGRVVVNRGVGGMKSADLIEKVTAGAFRDVRPRIVVIQIGGNGGAPEEFVPLAGALRAEFPDGKLVFTSLVGGGAQRRNMSDALRALVDDRRIYFVDLEPIFWDPVANKIRPEQVAGVNITVNGYRDWAEAMKPLIERLLNESPAATARDGAP